MSIRDKLVSLADALKPLVSGGKPAQAKNSNGPNSSLGIDQFVSKSFFKPYLDKDTFYGSIASKFDPKVSGGALSGVKALLNAIRSGFGATAGIASAIFRLSIQDWALGLLTQAAVIIQGFLANVGTKNTPEGNEATGLNAIVNALTGLIKGFYTEKIEIIKSNKQLGKDMNEIGKPA